MDIKTRLTQRAATVIEYERGDQDYDIDNPPDMTDLKEEFEIDEGTLARLATLSIDTRFNVINNAWIWTWRHAEDMLANMYPDDYDDMDAMEDCDEFYEMFKNAVENNLEQAETK